ncbi:MAG: hypothetical protein QNK37_12190 [Acidobacteriota bacterium]|nr:hypothetical protein [Acidobacteriota bacterium]
MVKPTPVLILLCFLPCWSQEKEEKAPAFLELKAAEVLPADMLEGRDYRIDEVVRNDGVMNYFVIHSSFGEMSAEGEAMLRIRLDEVRAIRELETFSKTEVFLDAVKTGVAKPVNTALNVVRKPFSTIKNIPGGTVRFFKVNKRKIQEGYEDAKEFIEKEKKKKKSGEGDGKAGDKTTLNEAAAEVQDAAVSYIGIKKSHRRWARKLKIDPYSSNEVVRKKIGEVAWYDTAGNMAAGFAPSDEIIGYLGDINEIVWEKDPIELLMHNEKVLAGMGVDKAMTRQFLKGSNYSPSQQTVLLEALKKMKGVAGRREFLAHALTAQKEMEAILFAQSAVMMADIHQKEKPLRMIAVGDRPMGAIAEDGQFLIIAAVDRVYLTEEMAENLSAYIDIAEYEGAGELREIRLSGVTDPSGKRKLADLGFTLKERVSLGLFGK